MKMMKSSYVIIQLKIYLMMSTKVYTTPFKQKAKKRFISIRSEGVDRALYSELVEVRKQLSDKLDIPPVNIFLIIHLKNLRNVNQKLNKK